MLAPLLFVSMMMLQGAAQAPDDFEQFRIEITGSYWRLNPTGNVQTSSTEVDLRSDLGIRGQKGHGLFKVAVKPARQHKSLFSSGSYRLRRPKTVTPTT